MCLARHQFNSKGSNHEYNPFTTQDLERCQISARAVALFYKWWSWYCLAAKPDARMEGIISRPLLFADVVRMTKHAGQSTLHLIPLHAKRTMLIKLICNDEAKAVAICDITSALESGDLQHRITATYPLEQFAESNKNIEELGFTVVLL